MFLFLVDSEKLNLVSSKLNIPKKNLLNEMYKTPFYGILKKYTYK